MIKEKILFLCTGNSCRSQIAEALLRSSAGDFFEVYSAGTKPAKNVHPLAIKVMSEIGLDLTKHRPKDLKEFLGRYHLDWIIIVCNKAKNTCPKSWPHMLDNHQMYWPFQDPAAVTGPEDMRLAIFRKVRDQIRAELAFWLDNVRKINYCLD